VIVSRVFHIGKFSKQLIGDRDSDTDIDPEKVEKFRVMLQKVEVPQLTPVVLEEATVFTTDAVVDASIAADANVASAEMDVSDKVCDASESVGNVNAVDKLMSTELNDCADVESVGDMNEVEHLMTQDELVLLVKDLKQKVAQQAETIMTLEREVLNLTNLNDIAITELELIEASVMGKQAQMEPSPGFGLQISETVAVPVADKKSYAEMAKKKRAPTARQVEKRAALIGSGENVEERVAAVLSLENKPKSKSKSAAVISIFLRNVAFGRYTELRQRFKSVGIAPTKILSMAWRGDVLECFIPESYLATMRQMLAELKSRIQIASSMDYQRELVSQVKFRGSKVRVLMTKSIQNNTAANIII
jgi:hypothetical protein